MRNYQRFNINDDFYYSQFCNLIKYYDNCIYDNNDKNKKIVKDILDLVYTYQLAGKLKLNEKENQSVSHIHSKLYDIK